MRHATFQEFKTLPETRMDLVRQQMVDPQILMSEIMETTGLWRSKMRHQQPTASTCGSLKITQISSQRSFEEQLAVSNKRYL